jgi:hypothetical protein
MEVKTIVKPKKEEKTTTVTHEPAIPLAELVGFYKLAEKEADQTELEIQKCRLELNLKR